MSDLEDDDIPEATAETSNALRPITIKQLQSARQAHADAKYRIDESEVEKVTCVAGVVALNSDAKRRAWLLQDGSPGQVWVTFWKNKSNDYDYASLAEIQQHSWVRVIGTIKRFRETNQLTVIRIRPINDPHEPFYHLLEAMMTTLYHDRGPIPAGSLQGIVQGSPGSSQLSQGFDMVYSNDHVPSISQSHSQSQPARDPTPPPSQTQHDPTPPSSPTQHTTIAWEPSQDPDVTVRNESHRSSDESGDEDSDYISVSSGPPPSRSPSPSPGPELQPEAGPSQAARLLLQRDPYSHYSNVQRAIILQIQNNDHLSPDGVSMNVVIRGLARLGLTGPQIEDAIDELMEAGIIYSTMDETHLKLVD